MAKIDQIRSEHEKFAIRQLKNNFKLKENDYHIDSDGHVIHIDLSNRKLNKIPELIENLSFLQTLNISHNKIRKIESIDNLKNLKSLNLHANIIEEISGLEKLSQLININLLGNQIKKIKGLDSLTNLQILNLYNNQIKKLEGLENLSSLLELHLGENPLGEVDSKIYEQSASAIVKYCKKKMMKISEIKKIK